MLANDTNKHEVVDNITEQQSTKNGHYFSLCLHSFLFQILIIRQHWLVITAAEYVTSGMVTENFQIFDNLLRIATNHIYCHSYKHQACKIYV